MRWYLKYRYLLMTCDIYSTRKPQATTTLVRKESRAKPHFINFVMFHIHNSPNFESSKRLFLRCKKWILSCYYQKQNSFNKNKFNLEHIRWSFFMQKMTLEKYIGIKFIHNVKEKKNSSEIELDSFLSAISCAFSLYIKTKKEQVKAWCKN